MRVNQPGVGQARHADAVRRRGALAPLLCSVLCLAACATDPAARIREQADAQIELSRRQDQQAREQYDDRAVYRGLIERMQQQGLYFASLAHLDAFEQRFGPAEDIAMLRADALRETGQEEAATAAYRNLLGTAAAARAYHGLGLLAGRRGSFEEAVSQLEAALQREPTNALIASDLGYALMRAGRLQQARVPVMQALELDGSNPRIVSNAAVWLTAARQREPAMALMERAGMSAAARKAVAQEAERIAREAARQPRRTPRNPAAARGSTPRTGAPPGATAAETPGSREPDTR